MPIPTPATVDAGESFHASAIALSAALHFAGDLEASRSVPHSPSSERGRARASRTERHRRRSSLRPTLAAPPRFVALRAAQPRAEARPSLHERGRALPRPNRPSTELRPPLAIAVPAELRPSSSSSLSEVSSAQNRPTVSSIAASSYSPTFSPPESAPPSSNRSRAAAERAARRPRTPPALPGRRPSPLTRALGPPGNPSRAAARSRSRRASPRPERRAPPAPPPRRPCCPRAPPP